MVDCVLRLDIEPLTTYSDGKQRKTTLTSFEEVLQTKEQAQVQETAGAKVQSSEEAKDTSVTFCDPSTGQAVKYVDVADDEDETTTAGKTSNSKKTTSTKKTTTSKKTTTADSMKTTKYDSYFKKAAKKYNVSESLLKGIAKAESNFNASDVSSSGAIGVMQLMPSTAKSLGVSDPYDAEENIMGGAKCIAQKLKEFDGDERLALAAYNAGSGAVKRYGGVPSYCKTYVNRVQSYKKAYETAAES
jgi:membrane-bound lytic murein transglycosylase B